MLLKLRALPDCSADQLKEGIRKAVQQQASDVSAPSIGPRTLRGRLPSGTRLEAGAEQLAQESPEDAAAVRYFSSIVEASYLVAGSDGLDANEREAMTRLFAETTGQAVDPSELEVLFARFDELRESEGLEQRLAAVASSFEDFMEREEALSFAALVAISDTELSSKEAVALVALGARLGFSAGEVQIVLDGVATTLGAVLTS